MGVMIKQLNEADLSAVEKDRCYQAFDRQAGLSARAQALLAAAGEFAPARRWFVATVGAGLDGDVGIRLDAACIERWTPEVVVKVRRRGSMKAQACPSVSKLAFPGYVFVRVAGTSAAWAGLSSIKGITGMLGVEGRPTPIAEQAITDVRAFLRGERAPKIVANALSCGDGARITEGPFADFTGRVQEVRDGGAALLEILLFGRHTRVTVDLAQLRKL